jgi:hypothetical protein
MHCSLTNVEMTHRDKFVKYFIVQMRVLHFSREILAVSICCLYGVFHFRNFERLRETASKIFVPSDF